MPVAAAAGNSIRVDYTLFEIDEKSAGKSHPLVAPDGSSYYDHDSCDL